MEEKGSQIFSGGTAWMDVVNVCAASNERGIFSSCRYPSN